MLGRLASLAPLLLLAAPAAAAPNAVTMTVTAHGSSLDVALHNTTGRAITIEAYVQAQHRNYDALSVTLTAADGGHRTLQFSESRDKAAPISADIAAGAALTQTVDLVPWAFAEGNGAPLAPGSYRVDATWDDRNAAVPIHATATTTLVIPAAAATCTHDPAAGGASDVVLLVRQPDAKQAVIEVGLHNPSATTVCVANRDTLANAESAWLTVHLPDWVTPKDGRATVKTTARDLHFSEPHRTMPATELAELAPGATAWTTWDLAAWAQRGSNGAQRLPAGTTWATVVYDQRGQNLWHGRARGELRPDVPGADGAVTRF